MRIYDYIEISFIFGMWDARVFKKKKKKTYQHQKNEYSVSYIPYHILLTRLERRVFMTGERYFLFAATDLSTFHNSLM
jgi:hypothetical protein